MAIGRVVAAVVACALILAAIVVVARDARAYLWLKRSVGPLPSVVARPADAAAFGLRDVRFATPDGAVMRGWLVPPRNGAVVVLCHGSVATRESMWPEARELASAGFGVLLFDWPTQGESGGRAPWLGPSGRAALRAAVGFVLAQPGVDSGRVGVYGFSYGGWIVAQVAAADARLRAVALASTPADLLRQVDHEFAGGTRRWGARLALRAAGVDLERAGAAEVVGRIAPRPLLVLAVSDDPVVSSADARVLFARAGEPKTLWIVRGATHGGHATLDPRFGARLRDFYSRALAVPEGGTTPP